MQGVKLGNSASPPSPKYSMLQETAPALRPGQGMAWKQARRICSRFGEERQKGAPELHTTRI